jgi:hypothetical protein
MNLAVCAAEISTEHEKVVLTVTSLFILSLFHLLFGLNSRGFTAALHLQAHDGLKELFLATLFQGVRRIRSTGFCFGGDFSIKDLHILSLLEGGPSDDLTRQRGGSTVEDGRCKWHTTLTLRWVMTRSVRRRTRLQLNADSWGDCPSKRRIAATESPAVFVCCYCLCRVSHREHALTGSRTLVIPTVWAVHFSPMSGEHHSQPLLRIAGLIYSQPSACLCSPVFIKANCALCKCQWPRRGVNRTALPGRRHHVSSGSGCLEQKAANPDSAFPHQLPRPSISGCRSARDLEYQRGLLPTCQFPSRPKVSPDCLLSVAACVPTPLSAPRHALRITTPSPMKWRGPVNDAQALTTTFLGCPNNVRAQGLCLVLAFLSTIEIQKNLPPCITYQAVHVLPVRSSLFPRSCSHATC